MSTVIAILIGGAALIFFIWLMRPSSSQHQGEGEWIDPSDSQQLARLIGMAGGNAADAATARFALERFEQIHGRKATTRDIATVVGLMR